MPLTFTQDRQAIGLPTGQIRQEPETVDTTFMQELGAAFQRENSVGSFIAQDRLSGGPVDAEYDVFSDIDGYEDYAKSFVYADNAEDVAIIKRNIDREIENTTLLDNAGASGYAASFIAAMLDPVNLVPVGGTAVKSAKLGKSVLNSGLATAKAGFLGATAAEALLQSSQETRTLGESAFNVGAGTFVAGVLGAASPVVARQFSNDFDAVMRGVENDLAVNPEAPDLRDAGGFRMSEEALLNDTSLSTVGAARAPSTNMADETLRSALGMEKALSWQDPLMRTSTSLALSTRKHVQNLVRTPFQYEKNTAGIATAPSVEVRIDQWRVPLADSMVNVEQNFVKYRQGQSGGRLQQLGLSGADFFTGKARRDGKLTYREFREEVGRAMRRADTHPIPEVAEAAQFVRKTLFDPLKDLAIERGALPEDVTVDTALSYLTRVYNTEKIVQHYDTFHGRIHQWLIEERDNAQVRAEEIQRELDELNTQAEIQKNKTDLEKAADERQDLQDQANKPKFDRTANLVRRPLTLRGFIRRHGGIKDDTGDLAAMDLRKSGRMRGVINNNGKSADDILGMAQEAGFFPADDPNAPATLTPNDLFDAIRREADGEDVIRESDRGLLEENMQREALREQDAEMELEIERIQAEAADREITLTDNDALKIAKMRYTDVNLSIEEGVERIAVEHYFDEIQPEYQKISPDEIDAEFRTENEVNTGNGTDLEGRPRSRTEGGPDAPPAKSEANSEQSRQKLQEELDDLIYRADFEDQELLGIAHEMIDRILGTPDGRLPYNLSDDVPGRRGKQRGELNGIFKARSLLFPDEMVEDFLESDIDLVAQVYNHSMAPDVELLGRFSDVDMTQELQDIAEEWNKKLLAAKTQKERKKLQKQKDKDLQDVAALRDRLRGTYGMPKNPNGLAYRISRASRQANLLSKLGGRLVSSFPDIARPVMTEGIVKTFGRGLTPMVSNAKAFKVARKEAARLGSVTDLIMQSRLQNIGETFDIYGRGSRIERALKGMTDSFGLVTLAAPWDQFLKEFTGAITMSRILEESGNWKAGKISKANLTKLAASGIDEETALRIANQFEKFGDTDGGVWISNAESWDDPIAYAAMRDAMTREISNAIITPGVGQRPLWMSSEAGKLVGQFKSFSMASSQSILIAGLQQRDAGVMNGMALAVGMGMMVYYLKSLEAGREVSDDPRVWVAEGIDRSGLMGWFFDANNMVEKATRGEVGVNKLVGGPMMSRYASRNLTGALLGPSFGQAQALGQITGSAFARDWTESDTHAVRRLVPYQNLSFVRHLFNKAEEGINDIFGVR